MVDTKNTKCSPGQIIRDAYTKKVNNKIIKVDSVCIKDKGKPGKGPKLIVMPDEDIGLLKKYGYSLKDSYEKRIIALKKANIKENNLKILRHINALRTLQKSNEKYYNKLDKDFKWLQKEYYKY
jgi:hypothetical protein